MKGAEVIGDKSVDEYEFSLVLEMALNVTRKVHLDLIDQRDPDLLDSIHYRLEQSRHKDGKAHSEKQDSGQLNPSDPGDVVSSTGD